MKVFKVKYAGLGKGSPLAPDIVENALKELYVNEEGFVNNLDFIDIKIDPNNIDSTMDSISDNVQDRCIVLGGDHSITYGAFKRFVKENPNCGLIVFDAHADCMDNIRVTQENYLSVLINEGMLKASNVIIIGLRNWHSNEIEFLKQNKILFFNMKKVFDFGVKEVCDVVMEKALEWNKVYVSIDIDAVDPAFAPGTGYSEPGGLSSRELIYFLQRIKKMRNIGMFDLVEINPSKDVNEMTVKLGAKILKEIAL